MLMLSSKCKEGQDMIVEGWADGASSDELLPRLQHLHALMMSRNV